MKINKKKGEKKKKKKKKKKIKKIRKRRKKKKKKKKKRTLQTFYISSTLHDGPASALTHLTYANGRAQSCEILQKERHFSV